MIQPWIQLSHAIACDDFTRLHSLVMDNFVDIIIADITVGREIDASQKLGLADKTRCTVCSYS